MSRLSVLLLVSLGICFGKFYPLNELNNNSQWVLGPPAPEHLTMTLHAMLKHDPKDVENLEKVLMEVSDPDSPSYGKHLSLEEVGKLTPIAPHQLEIVMSFFGAAEHLQLSPNKDMLTVVVKVADVQRLFQTQVHVFAHQNGGSALRAHGDYFIPEKLEEVIYVIGGLFELPSLPIQPVPVSTQSKAGWINACPHLNCQGQVTPAVLLDRYNVDGSGMDAKGNSMAVAEFQGQYFKESDLEKFSQGCGVNVTVDKVIGGNEERAGVESELDIQYIRGVSPGIPLTVIYSTEYSLLGWVSDINGRDDAELVHSVSYGNDERQQSSVNYMLSCNVQFMKAGARGISILFASGDQGVCGRSGCGIFNKKFKPDFPAGSPYITAVGGTDFLGSDIGEETTWKASGGGFSNTFDMPDWQADAVAGYKADPDADLPPQKMWNDSGRGYPDVSALGGQKNPYCVVANGIAEGVAGTSASCPVVAAIFARLNGLRLKANKSPLGFLNPFIYKNPGAFNDVTSGCNSGGGFNRKCFKAINGWDPATGMGTPNYGKLAAVVLE